MNPPVSPGSHLRYQPAPFRIVRSATADAEPLVPRTLGADFELANFFVGSDGRSIGLPARAVKTLLEEFPGIPSRRNSSWSTNGLDMHRRFLPHLGAGPYDDSSHFEWTIAEQMSAREYTAAVRAGLAEAADATRRINRRLNGEKLRVHHNNSDLQGSSRSYGTHLNLTVSRDAFESMTSPGEPQRLLASFQAALAPLLGQGKTCSDNGRPETKYQLSQRADFFHVLASHDTMVNRGLVNLRDEPHAHGLARLHVIAFDAALAQTAIYLRAGAMQIATAMIEARVAAPDLVLHDPVLAFRMWSHDPTLQRRVPLEMGGSITLADWLRRFHELMSRFVAQDRCDHVVTEAARIVNLLGQVLDWAAQRDLAALSHKLDWALKLGLITQAMENHHLDWNSSEVRCLDLLYSSLDDGLFFEYENEGAVDHIVGGDDIARHRVSAPEDTRAWTRSRLLQLADPHQVALVDWDRIIFDLTAPDGRSVSVQVSLPTPYTLGKEDSGIAHAHTLGEALLALDESHQNVSVTIPLRTFLAPAPTSIPDSASTNRPEAVPT